jgi:hypothetical protein
VPLRRADRLFDIIRILRTAAQPVTAVAIAEELEVTVRTVYRDVATLQARRIPIEGAAGVGYVLRRGYELPPLMFTEENPTISRSRSASERARRLRGGSPALGVASRAGKAGLNRGVRSGAPMPRKTELPVAGDRGVRIRLPPPAGLSRCGFAIRRCQRIHRAFFSATLRRYRAIISV